jgi:hypothetical protein
MTARTNDVTAIVPTALPTTTPGTDDEGAYGADVLRVIRGTPNPEELAALVAALLLIRRSRTDQHVIGPGDGAPHIEPQTGRDEALGSTAPPPQDRPAWLRGPYSAPGSWTAGP